MFKVIPWLRRKSETSLGSMRLKLKLINLARLAGQRAPESFHFCLLSAGVTGVFYLARLSTEHWGSELKSFCLCSKHFNN